MTGHPDWDTNVTWIGDVLFSQAAGAYPADGTVLYSGPVTGWPGIFLRATPSAGGVRVSVHAYADAALTQQVSNDNFDASSHTVCQIAYQVRAPYIKITLSGQTSAPAAAGALFIYLIRGDVRNLVPMAGPQSIALESVVIAAGASADYYFGGFVYGNVEWNQVADLPANLVKAKLTEEDYAGNVILTHWETGALVTPVQKYYQVGVGLLHLHLNNPGTVAHTVTLYLMSQQQGW